MKLKLIHSFLFALVSTWAYSQSGHIRGIIFDGGTGEYLPGVTVYAEGTTSGTISDLDGNFNLSLAAGTYSLRISFISYETMLITDVEVSADEVTSLGEIKLEEATISLNEVTITAKAIRNTETALISMKRRSPNVIDGISEGSIKRNGDSDAASAMKRVPGVSVSQGKYVYVRGLGDRYSKSLLNGVDIPGLDPDRNTLQMDIFPTSMINNIIVHKTFSAELPADFTGGAVDIEIRDLPEKKQGSISAGIGYNPNSSFNKNYLSYEGGKTDWLGFDDGTRAIPVTEDIPQFTEAIGDPYGEAGERYREILHSFNPTMATLKTMSLADFSFGVSYGNQKPMEKRTLGYNVSFDYKNTTDFYEDAEYGRYGLSEPSVYEMDRREYQFGDFGVNTVLVSALAGLNIKTDRSKIRLNLMHIQNGESKAGDFYFIGSDQGSDFDALQYGLDYSQRSLSHLLIDGNHSNTEKNNRINWKLAGTYSTLNDPDIRFTRYEVNDDGSLRIGTEVGFPERIWRELDEVNTTGLINYTKVFQLLARDAKLHAGVLATYKYRDYQIRNFAVNPRGGYPLTGDPNELFAKENLWIKDGNIGMGTTYETPFIPTNPNKYNASSVNTAGYISAELPLSEKLNAILGLRIENIMQYYTGTDQLNLNVMYNESVLNDLGFFPSINLLYHLTQKQNLRISYTQTIARPSFKELSYAEIYDPITGVTFIGSFHKDGDDIEGVQFWDGNLVSTDIQNIDLRWERYGVSGQLFSISGFYKTFKNPIEIVQYTKQVGAFQPRNVGDGQSYGIELELRQGMGFIAESISALRLNLNVTLNKSSIEMSKTEYQSRVENAREGETIDFYRPMAGQSPYLINGGLSYNGGKEGFWNRFEAGLYYNVQGATLEFIGAADRPDIYAEPFHSLNFNSSVSFGNSNKMSLGLKIQNLINEEIQLVYKSYKATDRNFERRSPGVTSTLKFTYRF